MSKIIFDKCFIILFVILMTIFLYLISYIYYIDFMRTKQLEKLNGNHKSIQQCLI